MQPIDFNISRFLESISLALDYVEMDVLKNVRHHGKRVAYISINIGRALKLDEEDIFDLYALSILHDNGLSVVVAKKSERSESLLSFEDMAEHTAEGEQIVQTLPLFKARKNVIRFHHENYNGTGYFGVVGDNIPLFSQIIHLADAIDINFDLATLEPYQRDHVRNFVKQASGTHFSPVVVDAFQTLHGHDRFWYDLQFYNITDVLNSLVASNIYPATYTDIIPLSQSFMNIIDRKSKFTLRHSHELAEKIIHMARYYGMNETTKAKLHIAANLHDIGKLYVPNTILEKPGSLTSEEFDVMKKHAYFTKLALRRIPGFEDICQWAGNHHEKLNGRGYPEQLDRDTIDFESRLVCALDIYQALTEDRPYRSAMSHRTAITLIQQLADEDLIDAAIADDITREFN